MGIKDEFHQKAILSCISELLKQLEEDDAATTSEYNESDEQFPHKMTQHSFNKLERCEKCNKYLRGLVHQGLICQGNYYSSRLRTINWHLFLRPDCGMIAHRTCAATGLPSCRQQGDKSSSVPNKTIFGQALCMQFMPSEYPAPFLVSVTCTRLSPAHSNPLFSKLRSYSAPRRWKPKLKKIKI